MRDITIGETIYIPFTTRAFATGIPTVLAGTPAVSAYVGAGLTQITAGITLGVDHDGVVGLNMLTIVATVGNGFANNTDVALVITAGTVSTVSVVGEVVGGFTIGRSSAYTSIGAAGAGLTAITGVTLAPTTGLGNQTANITGNLVGTVSTLTTYTGNTPQTGDSFARLGAPAGASIAADLVVIDNFVDGLEADVTAIKAKTDSLTFTVAGLIDSNTLRWLGTACATPGTAGLPMVEIDRINGVVITGNGAGTPFNV